VRIVRFLSTTPDSSDIELVLHSLIMQIRMALGRNVEELEKEARSLTSLIKLFKKCVDLEVVVRDREMRITVQYMGKK